MRMRKSRNGSYPTCFQCDAEINPGKGDDCEKYYIVEDQVYCKDCFKEWVLDYVETNLDDVAALFDVPVVEVE